MSYCTIKIGSLFDSTAAELARFWDFYKEIDNTKSKEVLGIKYRPTQETLVEMGHSIINSGVVEDKRKEKK